MQIVHNALFQQQLAYEAKYNKMQRKRFIKEHFSVLLEPMQRELDEYRQSSEFKLDEYNKAKKVMDIVLDVMFVLSDKPVLTINTVIQMLQEKLECFDDFIEPIMVGANYGLYQVFEDGRYWRLKRNWEISTELQQVINEFKYLNPMLVSPLKVNQRGNNKGSGYLTIGSDSLILGGIYHGNQIDSTLLDTLNSTKWELNEDVIRTIRNEWSDLDAPKKQGIDQKHDETAEEYAKRVASFEQYEKACYIAFAEMIKNGNKFYLTHKYDKRGRIYNCGYAINYQGNSYAKSVLNFKNKELITDEIHFFK